MRLTERKVCYPRCDKQGNLTRVDYIEIKDKKLAEEKLCQLEDIEDELGIELTKLNEIRKVKEGYAFSDGYLMHYEITEIDLIKGIVKGICDGCWHTEKLKDYGKTWALTKEELL